VRRAYDIYETSAVHGEELYTKWVSLRTWSGLQFGAESIKIRHSQNRHKNLGVKREGKEELASYNLIISI
jgi:hypothetical protein